MAEVPEETGGSVTFAFHRTFLEAEGFKEGSTQKTKSN
jgi:hypothetical protein